MTPPAWSAFPEIGLNFTSTKPSRRLVSSLRQTGYVARPDCFRTLGLLGALSSCSIVHFASPLPVLVAVQPVGGAPVFMLSKLTVSANAIPAAVVIVSIAIGSLFIGASSYSCGQTRSRLAAPRNPL